MVRDDLNYYEQRAEAEIAMAQRATHAEVVRAHYELATAYLDRIHGEQSEAAEPGQA